jgi:hypothetical protein
MRSGSLWRVSALSLGVGALLKEAARRRGALCEGGSGGEWQATHRLARAARAVCVAVAVASALGALVADAFLSTAGGRTSTGILH